MMTRIMDVLANLGLVVRWNDPRNAGHVHQHREWGPVVEDFSLSLEAVKATLFIALKNVGSKVRQAAIPDWLSFYQVAVTGPEGQPVPLKPYGRQLLESHQSTPPREVTFAPGQSVETEIPLAPLYDLRPGKIYRVTISCTVPGSQEGDVLTSNEVQVSPQLT